MAEVDVVRWFVEDKDRWLFKDEAREGHETLLPFGECMYFFMDNIRADQELGRDPADLAFVLFNSRLRKHVKNRRTVIESGKILRVVANLGGRVQLCVL